MKGQYLKVGEGEWKDLGREAVVRAGGRGLPTSASDAFRPLYI